MIHPLAEVQSKKVGENTSIWQFSIVLPDAEIGTNCNINSHVLIANDVKVGDNVTIKCGVQIWDGLRIEDNVFIGPNVTFTNDLIPRSKIYPELFLRTTIKKRASIGANSTIIGGLTIGEYAMIGAGSVVTKSINKNELWYGNPAEKKGYITDSGEILDMDLVSKETGKKYIWNENKLIQND